MPKDGKLLAIGHSMGGILLYSMLSRFGEFIASLVLIGHCLVAFICYCILLWCVLCLILVMGLNYNFNHSIMVWGGNKEGTGEYLDLEKADIIMIYMEGILSVLGLVITYQEWNQSSVYTFTLGGKCYATTLSMKSSACTLLS